MQRPLVGPEGTYHRRLAARVWDAESPRPNAAAGLPPEGNPPMKPPSIDVDRRLARIAELRGEGASDRDERRGPDDAGTAEGPTRDRDDTREAGDPS